MTTEPELFAAVQFMPFRTTEYITAYISMETLNAFGRASRMVTSLQRREPSILNVTLRVQLHVTVDTAPKRPEGELTYLFVGTPTGGPTVVLAHVEDKDAVSLQLDGQYLRGISPTLHIPSMGELMFDPKKRFVLVPEADAELKWDAALAWAREHGCEESLRKAMASAYRLRGTQPDRTIVFRPDFQEHCFVFTVRNERTREVIFNGGVILHRGEQPEWSVHT
jgi:hypothetical protein